LQIHLKGGAIMEENELRKDELVNIIKVLRKKGWSDTEIVNHLLEIEGEEVNEEEKEKE